jgi:hypothetical protein
MLLTVCTLILWCLLILLRPLYKFCNYKCLKPSTIKKHKMYCWLMYMWYQCSFFIWKFQYPEGTWPGISAGSLGILCKWSIYQLSYQRASNISRKYNCQRMASIFLSFVARLSRTTIRRGSSNLWRLLLFSTTMKGPRN